MWTRSSAIFLAALGLLGCQRLDRISECRSLAEAVNPVLETIDAERKRAPEHAGAYRAIAGRYEALAGKLSRFASHTKRLDDSVAEYEKVLREGARDARTFADALDSKLEARILGGRSASERTTKREAALVVRIDGVCRGK